VFAAPDSHCVSESKSKSKSKSESGRQDGSITDNTSGSPAPRADTTDSVSDSTHTQSDCKSDDNAEAVAVSMLIILMSDSRVNKALVTRCADDSTYEHSTALIYAAKNGHESIVQLFLDDPRVDKALIDHGCVRGCTALMHAAHEGWWKCCLLMLASTKLRLIMLIPVVGQH
jgi:Ankyrin repeats (3 copies)